MIVHTLDDKSVRGMLAEVGRDGLLLRAAVFLAEETELPLSGELWLPDSNIRFVQLGVAE